MTHRYASLREATGIVHVVADLPLEIAKMVAGYAQTGLHQLLVRDKELRKFLVQHDAQNPCLVYHGPGSAFYKTCKKPPPGLIAPDNVWDYDTGEFLPEHPPYPTCSRVYDDETDRFVEWRAGLCRVLQLRNIVARCLPAMEVQRADLPVDKVVFLAGELFPDKVLDQLQEMRYLSGPVEVPSYFLS